MTRLRTCAITSVAVIGIAATLRTLFMAVGVGCSEPTRDFPVTKIPSELIPERPRPSVPATSASDGTVGEWPKYEVFQYTWNRVWGTPVRILSIKKSDSGWGYDYECEKPFGGGARFFEEKFLEYDSDADEKFKHWVSDGRAWMTSYHMGTRLFDPKYDKSKIQIVIDGKPVYDYWHGGWLSTPPDANQEGGAK